MFHLLFVVPLLSQVGVNESQQFCKLAQKQNITYQHGRLFNLNANTNTKMSLSSPLRAFQG